jgi:hypothetical protein
MSQQLSLFPVTDGQDEKSPFSEGDGSALDEFFLQPFGDFAAAGNTSSCSSLFVVSRIIPYSTVFAVHSESGGDLCGHGRKLAQTL